MSCKCFNNKTIPSLDQPFVNRLELSKCSCASRFTVSENKRKFCIEEGIIKLVDKIKIDGCLDSSVSNKKCDYLFILKNKDEKLGKTFIFVELKGSDIKTAIEQIGCTIIAFYNENYLNNQKVRGVVVFSTYPKDNGSYRKAKKTLLNQLSSKVKDFRIEEKSIEMKYNVSQDRFY